MPYVDCAGCGRNVFMAAYWSIVERCPHCDGELPPARAAAQSRPTAGRRGAVHRSLQRPARAFARER